MNIFVSGINYKTTPLEIREKISLSVEEQKLIIDELMKLPEVCECVVLSTCNRTEVYVYSSSCRFNNESIEKLLCSFKGLNIYEYKKYFYFYSSSRAVKHLFKVASGLDSMVLGEDQILSQVRDSHELSMKSGASLSILNTLFRDAVTAAKNIKTYTDLSKNSTSIASLSVKLISDFFGGRMENKCALVIGAGKIGSIALKNLISYHTGKIYFTVRSHSKAEEFSEQYDNVYAISYADRYSVINECDAVISSTASPHYTITRDVLEKTLGDKKDRLFIDLAVPRDIDMSITGIEGARYFNMDDLQLKVDENIDKRLLEASRAEEIIDRFVLDYEKWYDFRGVLPVIKDIQKYTYDILNERVNSTLARLKCSSEEDREIIKASMAATVNEIMNKFIYSVRECGSKEDIEAYFRCLEEVIRD